MIPALVALSISFIALALGLDALHRALEFKKFCDEDRKKHARLMQEARRRSTGRG